MPWELHTHHDSKVIEIVYRGLVTAPELERAAECAYPASQSTGFHRILADCSSLEGGHSLIDLYLLAGNVANKAAGVPFREAVVFAADVGQERIQFWETTCVNRGLDVRAFEIRDDALRWLVE